jgi:hypothetical protein
LVKLKDSRTKLPEYGPYINRVAEIQVRTILQHAWAEIEHDIEYKTSVTIPKAIKRRFMALAGLLEIADREFQSIQNENENLMKQSNTSVEHGKLEDVEINRFSLKTYLDQKYGTDGRMTDFSYEFTAKRLIQMGFESLKQVDACIAEYDDDKVSRAIWGTRCGQVQRFSDVIFTSLGEEYIKVDPWCAENAPYRDYWVNEYNRRLEKLAKAGIVAGKYKLLRPKYQANINSSDEA